MNLTRILQAWKDRKQNALWLRRVADEVGREIEAWPYDRFQAPPEQLSFSREIDGIEVGFSIEAYEENDQGDVHVCVDVDASLPTASLVLPSYVFWKRRNGSVDYE